MPSLFLIIGFLSLLSLSVSFCPSSQLVSFLQSSTKESPSTTTGTAVFSTTEEARKMTTTESTTTTTASNPTLFTTKYTNEELKAALDSLLEGSNDKDFDGRHLFGYGDIDHTLSKLQAITATRILDYEAYLVRT